MKVETVPTDKIDVVWPMVSPAIVKCLHDIEADCTAADLWTMCRTGNAFLLVAHDGTICAATVWRFETWPSRKVLKNLVTVNIGPKTRMKSWLPQMIDAARTLAGLGGATSYIWQGRDEWARVFRAARKLTTLFEMRV